MKISKFRIKNFRSIIDTGWRTFSADGVTVLVGQNESGKSAILDALHTTFSQKNITTDDLRFDCDLPEILFDIEIEPTELKNVLIDYMAKEDIEKTLTHLQSIRNRTQMSFKWITTDHDQETSFKADITVVEPELEIPAQDFLDLDNENTYGIHLNVLAAEGLFRIAPTFTIFQSDSGLLPNTIDIDENNELVGEGKIAATNLLSIAEINIKDFTHQNNRSTHTRITRATNKINQDFSEFWNQNIDTNTKIKIEFSLDHHNTSNEKNAGRPYLAFWVTDGIHKLHPNQRSAGVRWFISFYLQLKASQKLNKNLHFLLDEPGANLHSNAQHDVLKLINTLSHEVPITYSTHSPSLIEHDKLYRVYAIQRKDDHLETPTEVIDAHRLGAASSDTLSPILMAIGSDFTHQNVIRKSGNIILEEVSGYYYLKAFFKLSNVLENVHFIAATGASKIPVLANMFTGWGLKFSVVIDDDAQGRSIYNKLKRELCGDDQNIANQKLYKIKDCKGIEDIFSLNDFLKFVLNSEHTNNENHENPTDIIKNGTFSKPILAYNFSINVEKEIITLEYLDQHTRKKILDTVTKILELVKNQ
ncbi:ATP-dependent nuclease [Pseudomonas sp. MDT2-39-1]